MDTENKLTAVHSLNVHFELLRLAEFTATEVAQRSSALGIRAAPVGAMHFQVVQSEEVFLAELTLVRPLSVMHFRSMLHDIVFAQHSHATHFTVVLADGQTKRGIMEHGAVCAIIQRVFEFQVAAATI